MNPSGGLVQSAVNAPMTVDIPDSFLNEALQFRELMMMYTCAIREVKTKLEVLNDDLAVRYQRNPIQMIKPCYDSHRCNWQTKTLPASPHKNPWEGKIMKTLGYYNGNYGPL